MNTPIFSEIARPDTLRIGNGFKAAQLRSSRFDGLIDPIMLIDHFTLSGSQEPYAYAGFSALTYLFEDSSPARYVEAAGTGMAETSGQIGAGDLYWLLAGRGALHGEVAQPGGNVKGLRIFVDLPARLKLGAPEGYHVPATAMPVIARQGVRARVTAGRSKNVATDAKLPQPFTMLDCRIDRQIRFAHPMPQDWNAVVYLVEGGPLTVTAISKNRVLQSGEAVALGTRHGGASVILSTQESTAHVVIIALPATEAALDLMVAKGGIDFDRAPVWQAPPPSPLPVQP